MVLFCFVFCFVLFFFFLLHFILNRFHVRYTRIMRLQTHASKHLIVFDIHRQDFDLIENESVKLNLGFVLKSQSSISTIASSTRMRMTMTKTTTAMVAAVLESIPFWEFLEMPQKSNIFIVNRQMRVWKICYFSLESSWLWLDVYWYIIPLQLILFNMTRSVFFIVILFVFVFVSVSFNLKDNECICNLVVYILMNTTNNNVSYNILQLFPIQNGFHLNTECYWCSDFLPTTAWCPSGFWCWCCLDDLKRK